MRPLKLVSEPEDTVDFCGMGGGSKNEGSMQGYWWYYWIRFHRTSVSFYDRCTAIFFCLFPCTIIHGSHQSGMPIEDERR